MRSFLVYGVLFGLAASAALVAQGLKKLGAAGNDTLHGVPIPELRRPLTAVEQDLWGRFQSWNHFRQCTSCPRAKAGDRLYVVPARVEENRRLLVEVGWIDATGRIDYRACPAFPPTEHPEPDVLSDHLRVVNPPSEGEHLAGRLEAK